MLDAGVVDEQVDAAEGLAGGGEGALHVALAGHVHRHGERLAAGVLDLADHRLRLVGRADVVDRHRGAVRGELEADPLADARVAAGDERAAAVEQARIGGVQGEGSVGHSSSR